MRNISTSSSILLPQWILYFKKAIDERLSEKMDDLTGQERNIFICIITEDFPYSWEGINALTRIYKNDIYNFRLKRFENRDIGGPRSSYVYTWEFFRE